MVLINFFQISDFSKKNSLKLRKSEKSFKYPKLNKTMKNLKNFFSKNLYGIKKFFSDF